MNGPQNIYDNKDFYEGYRKLRESPTNFNDLLEIPAMRQHIDSTIQLQGKIVLDVGCGSGGLTRHVAMQNAAHVYGIDVSSRMIQDAVSLTQLQNVSFEVKSLESFIDAHESERNKFDLVLSSLAFHYIEDYDSLIAGKTR